MSTQPILKQHVFDQASLARYMRSNVEGFSHAERTGPLEVSQFTHGQSNPTFLLKVGEGKARRKYVLRKKPSGKLLPSAHAVEREYRIISALQSTDVPVPKTYCLCEDSNVIGTPFYVMDFVEGRIFKDIELPNMNRKDRFAIYAAMCKTLAALHSVDYKAVGLGDYGKPRDYIRRQVKIWSRQYAASSTREIKSANKLLNYLETNLPTDDDSKRITLVHGDFRLDNLIFHPTDNRVVAVLDWELSTLGHPSTDLTYNCIPYYCSNDQPLLPGLCDLPLRKLGIPDQHDYVRAYVRHAHHPGRIQNWDYYLALSMFRIVAICEGVYKRFLQGNNSNSKAAMFEHVTIALADLAWKVINESRSKLVAADHSHGANKAIIEAKMGGFDMSDRFYELYFRLHRFIEEEIMPIENAYHDAYLAAVEEKGTRWIVNPLIDGLKAKAKAAGLWNLFLTLHPQHDHGYGPGLTNLEYAPLCELMGRYPWIAPETFNCAAPDTGNMEVLAIYGNKFQQEKWLKPLMEGKIRSCFGMTEPRVASSDATNIESTIVRNGDHYVVNGRKWWTSGAMDPRCSVCIFMGKTDVKAARHQQQSMIIVPMDAPGVKILRPLTVFGYDDAPHGHAEVEFTNVIVPVENLLLGEGRGFEISQGRLGPGRIHHCMRLIGMAERGLEIMCERVLTRQTFGTSIASKGTIKADIANSRIEIEQARLLVLQAAALMDAVGGRGARQHVAMIKVAVPNMTLKVLDRAIQAHGGAGVSQDTVLANLWAFARTLRIADGPDEVHRETITKIEMRRARL